MGRSGLQCVAQDVAVGIGRDNSAGDWRVFVGRNGNNCIGIRRTIDQGRDWRFYAID